MGSRMILSCDSCGKEQGKAEILAVDFKRSDGLRLIGELCTRCMDQLARDYNLTTTSKRRRSNFRVQEKI